MLPLEVDYIGEGRTDEVVARRLLLEVGLRPGKSYLRPMSGTGKDRLDKKLPGLNAGVQYGNPMLVLRDLDGAACPAGLVSDLLPNKHERLLLRICVRQVEAWFAADFEAYARYCGSKVSQIPKQPEAVPDLKRHMLNLAQSGHAGKLNRMLLEERKLGKMDWAILGEWHSEFAENIWSPSRASDSGRAPSLSKALLRMRELG